MWRDMLYKYIFLSIAYLTSSASSPSGSIPCTKKLSNTVADSQVPSASTFHSPELTCAIKSLSIYHSRVAVRFLNGFWLAVGEKFLKLIQPGGVIRSVPPCRHGEFC
jgi:hypothetical protein